MRDILSAIKPPKISQLVYMALKEKILSKDFAPGERLDMKVIEKQLGVSRTPLKEAISQLAAEGLVVVVARSGTFVTEIRPEEIADAIDVARALMLQAIEAGVSLGKEEDFQALKDLVRQMAALVEEKDYSKYFSHYQSLVNEFNEGVVLLAGNKRLLTAFRRENHQNLLARIDSLQPDEEMRIRLREYEQILSAIQARNAGKARKEMDAHLERIKQFLIN
jgi:DNA-binding GntR family transcriptional regulator